MTRCGRILSVAAVLLALIVCVPFCDNRRQSAAAEPSGATKGSHGDSARNNSDGEDAVPTPSRIEPVLLTFPDSLPELPGMVRPELPMVIAKSNRFVFPFLGLVFGEMSLRCGANKPVPLFTAEGGLNVPSNARDAVLVHVTLHDPLASHRHRDPLLKALMDRPELNGRTLAHPDLQNDFEVDLVAADPDSGGGGRTLATYRLRRELGKVRHSLSFRVAGPDLELLRASHRDDLSLAVRGTYQAEFSETDLQVSVRAVQEAAAGAVNKLLSTPQGAQPVLFVAVGGEAQLDQVIKQNFRSAVAVDIKRRAGSEVNGELVEKLLFQQSAEVDGDVKLQQENKSAVVSFLLADGVRFDVAQAQYQRISDKSAREREKKATDILETLSRKQTAREEGGGFGVFGVGGANVDTKYAEANEEQKKVIRDRLLHSLDQVEKAIEGNIPGLVGMRVDQVKKLASVTVNEKEFNVGTFRRGPKTFNMSLSFQAAGKTEADQLRSALKEAKKLIEVLASELEMAKTSLKKSIKATEELAKERDALQNQQAALQKELGQLRTSYEAMRREHIGVVAELERFRHPTPPPRPDHNFK
jgi:hypothetical protein